MAVTVEDGTIVAGADSFVDSAYVDAYAAKYGLTQWLAGAAQALKDAALREAGDWLKNEQRLVYRGTRVSYLQTMPYPREGASEYRGPAIPNNVIPWRLKDANAKLAVLAFASPGSLQPLAVRGGAVKREKVGEVEAEYFPGASTETLIRDVMGILAPLLLPDNAALAVPFQADNPTLDSVFDPGVFNNPTSEV